MKTKKLTVTIGICAFNEEKNIQNIINDIFLQVQNDWILKKVYIYSDGSTDNTVMKIVSLRNNKIVVLKNNERKGKSFGIQKIISKFDSDILLFLDADVRIKNKSVVQEIVKKFILHKDVMLVGGNTKPFTPKTFFQKAVYSTFKVFNKSREYVKDGNNIFGCTGGCMALRRKFANEINMKQVVNDDDFIYFSCISKGYTFSYVREAEVYYSLPKNTKDYLRQCFRSNPSAAILNMEQYFGELVAAEYSRSRAKYYKSILEEFVKNPFGVGYISFLNTIILPFQKIVSKNYKLEWFTATSTK